MDPSQGEAAHGAVPRAGFRAAWWSWPSLLALDAPVVGVAWLAAFGMHAGTRFDVAAMVVVGVSIWLVYVADHLLDCARMAGSDAVGRGIATPITPRHAFTERVGGPLAAAWCVALVADVAWAVATLQPPALLAGCAVTGVAAVTLDGRLRAWPGGAVVRSALVGLAFAGAVAVGLGGTVPWGTVAPLATFGVMCAANVALVGRWERYLCDGSNGSAPSAFAAIGLAVVAFAGSALLAATGGGPVASALAASSLALVALHAVHGRLEPDLARVCADAALVVPLGLFALAGVLA